MIDCTAVPPSLVIDIGSWATKLGHVDSVPLNVPSLVCEVPVRGPQLSMQGRRKLPAVKRTIVGEAVQSAVLSELVDAPSNISSLGTGIDIGSIFAGGSSGSVVCPFEDGRISDWSNFELMLNNICTERLEVALDLQPMTLCVPTMCTPREIQYYCELCFETFNVPKLTILAQDLAAAHNHPEPFTGVVVNIGHSITRLSGIVDGAMLHGIVADLPVAGKALGDCFASLVTLSKSCAPMRDSNTLLGVLPKVGALEGDIWWQTLKEKAKIRVADDISEEAFIEFQCGMEDVVDDMQYGSATRRENGLGGQKNCDRRRELKRIEDDIRTGVHRTAIEGALAAECLFNPSIVNYLTDNLASVPSSQRSLPDMVDRLIQQCPIDYRRQMYNGVMVVGGGANLLNVCRRLESSLREIVDERQADVYARTRHAPAAVSVKVFTPAQFAKSYATHTPRHTDSTTHGRWSNKVNIDLNLPGDVPELSVWRGACNLVRSGRSGHSQEDYAESGSRLFHESSYMGQLFGWNPSEF